MLLKKVQDVPFLAAFHHSGIDVQCKELTMPLDCGKTDAFMPTAIYGNFYSLSVLQVSGLSNLPVLSVLLFCDEPIIFVRTSM